MKRNLLFAFLALCCMSASSQIQKVLLPMGQQTFRPWVGKGYYASNEDVFPDDWMMPEFDDSAWRHAVFSKDLSKGILRKCMSPPIREDKVSSCKNLFQNSDGIFFL